MADEKGPEALSQDRIISISQKQMTIVKGDAPSIDEPDPIIHSTTGSIKSESTWKSTIPKSNRRPSGGITIENVDSIRGISVEPTKSDPMSEKFNETQIAKLNIKLSHQRNFCQQKNARYGKRPKTIISAWSFGGGTSEDEDEPSDSLAPPRSHSFHLSMERPLFNQKTHKDEGSCSSADDFIDTTSIRDLLESSIDDSNHYLEASDFESSQACRLSIPPPSSNESKSLSMSLQNKTLGNSLSTLKSMKIEGSTKDNILNKDSSRNGLEQNRLRVPTKPAHKTNNAISSEFPGMVPSVFYESSTSDKTKSSALEKTSVGVHRKLGELDTENDIERQLRKRDYVDPVEDLLPSVVDQKSNNMKEPIKGVLNKPARNEFARSSTHFQEDNNRGAATHTEALVRIACFLIILLSTAVGIVMGLFSEGSGTVGTPVGPIMTEKLVSKSWLELWDYCDRESKGTDFISTLPHTIQARIQRMRQGISKLLSNNVRFDSCSPQQLALVSIALVDGNSIGWGLLERYLLSSFFFATGGVTWYNSTGWIDDDEICRWHGISCSEDLLEVTGIELEANGLEGTIVDELFLLETLESLSIAGSNIGGVLTPNLGNLTNLQNLYLESTQMVTAIPSEIGLLTMMTSLVLNIPSLEKIPSEIGLLTDLTSLILHDFGRGSVPEQISNLEKLRTFSLSSGSNEYVAKVPPDLWLLPSLEDLTLRGFGEGIIPEAAFGDNSGWRSISVEFARLTGGIPTTIGYLDSLTTLRLVDTFIEGQLPTEIGLCTKLKTLDIDENSITGTIPKEMTNLVLLESLVLSSNQFTGTIPVALGSLSDLVTLDLGGNRLTGTVPASFSEMTDLQKLVLVQGRNHKITGSIPSSMCGEQNDPMVRLSVQLQCDAAGRAVIVCPQTCVCDCFHPNEVSVNEDV